MKKTYGLLLLALLVALTLCAASAEGMTEIDLSAGDVRITADGCTQNGAAIDSAEGYLIKQSDPAICGALEIEGGNHQITINGLNVKMTGAVNAVNIHGAANVSLSLEGANVMDASALTDLACIRVAPDSTLTLSGDASASLTVKGGFHGAGIGGNTNETPGAITVKNGNISAMGGVAGAGIGGGYMGHGGNITIEDGYIIATGNEAGAGIGGGWIGNCGKVTILGGTVEATGGARAAGIGNGSDMGGGFITIKGGTVNATAGLSSAAIGGGLMSQQGCTIVVEGGVVNATATQDGAGIGSGFAINYDVKDGGTLLITGGSVTEYSVGYEYLNALTTLKGGEYMSKTTVTDGIIIDGGMLKIMSTGRAVVPQPVEAVNGVATIAINYHTQDLEDADRIRKVTADFVLLTSDNPAVTADSFVIFGAQDLKLTADTSADPVTFTLAK